MYHRRGSVIIYCIALSSILVVVGYSFLRSTLHDTEAGDASQKVLLARSAARMGMMRASELILSDYAQPTMLLNQGMGGSVSMAGATYLDGSWHASLVSSRLPNQLQNVDANRADSEDDASAEHMVLQPLIRWQWASDQKSTFRYGWHSREGVMMYDGRGRYVEPGYHNITRPAPAGAASVPVVPTRFTDFSAAIPERSEGLFLDASGARIDTGSPGNDRLAARYRLRFTVGVEDLGGHLLANPDPTGDFDHRSATALYRNPPAWLSASADAWHNMISAHRFNGMTTPLRWEHLFLGRGNTSNVDLTVGSGAPVTFPRMFRHQVMVGGTYPYWGLFARERSKDGANSETEGLYPAASANGGEDIPAVSTESLPIIAHGYGPQVSWYNQHGALLGWLGGTYNINGYPVWEIDGDNPGEHAPDPANSQLAVTLFGRPLRKSAADPTTWKWYEGRVDTPFYVNLLTATPRTVHAMITAYLPPPVKNVYLDRERFFVYQGTGADGYDKWKDTGVKNDVFPGNPTAIGGRDLFTSFHSAAFSYAPPSADGLIPNYQKPDTRTIDQRYPGRLWNDLDELGKDIDVNHLLKIGACSHVRRPFFFGLSTTTRISASAGSGWSSSPPSGWGFNAKDFVELSASGTLAKPYTFDDSYWWDLVYAFTNALAGARAAWVQYPTAALNPYTDMDAGLHDPSAYDSLEEVDRLFLRELGEDFDTPGNGIALDQVVSTGTWDNFAQQYRQTGVRPNNTIRNLVDKGLCTPDQANVMERVLNDMRLSFFGAGPQYSETFRPKDFSGDGQVHCSGYAMHGGASLFDEENGLAWWKPVVASGTGPEVDMWFSSSGCFYIGRSHYFRIFSRGEVWDNVVRRPVSDITLESVLCVDPEGTDPTASRVLFQRWYYDRTVSHLPRQVD